ncbi:hypothetical protein B0H12DRAFT_77630 [Mycena haematopus]|nr:hypothetical protein B0H12DRAFT_77630 [Mycena haematopus]
MVVERKSKESLWSRSGHRNQPFAKLKIFHPILTFVHVVSFIGAYRAPLKKVVRRFGFVRSGKYDIPLVSSDQMIASHPANV